MSLNLTLLQNSGIEIIISKVVTSINEKNTIIIIIIILGRKP